VEEMNLKTVRDVLNAEVIWGDEGLNREVTMVGATDLMSDALYLLENSSLLLTGLITPQVIRTAEMLDLAGIVFVRGKIPPKETISLAQKIGIPLLTTRYPMYESCGKLYSAGFKGRSVD